MEIIVAGHDTVTELLTVRACIPIMRDTLAAVALIARGRKITDLANDS